MKKINQFERYQQERPDLFKKFADLESKHNTSIISKLENKRFDFDSFQGMLIELEFGLFLDEFCDNLKYSPVINGKTPDWLATVNGKRIIVEIARLKDTEEVERCTREDQEKKRIRFHRLGSRPERIYGNVISPKTEKYKEIITSEDYAFIIGIYNTPASEVRASDAAQLLHGRSIEFHPGGRIEIDRSDTIFYSDKFPEIKSLLNGVLWMNQPSFDPFTGIHQPNKFIYWGNDNAKNKLGNINALMRIAGSND